MTGRVVPLFPLNLVLFPGMVLPLRIFEPRYRLMLKRILQGERQFGVSLIASGEEVGGPASPYPVGTLAEVHQYEISPEGPILATCVGLRRFRIRREIGGEPYAQAEIELLEEPETPLREEVRHAAQEGLGRYVSALGAVTSMSITLPEEPLSPLDLSYLLSAMLPVDNALKQRLLEAPDAEARLGEALPLLEAENAALAAFLAQSRAHGDFFFRGHRLSLN